jgi:hypothetical protein
MRVGIKRSRCQSVDVMMLINQKIISFVGLFNIYTTNKSFYYYTCSMHNL